MATSGAWRTARDHGETSPRRAEFGHCQRRTAAAAAESAKRRAPVRQRSAPRHPRSVATRFRYVHPNGRRCPTPAELARIKSLVIPPAWTDVWICPDPRGHLQATGRDARGRKQYRYHPRWREVRDEAKYGRLLGVRAGAAAHPPTHRRRPAQARPAAREGAGRGRPAPREDADPRRQRGVRARQRLGRPDDDARPAREDPRRRRALRVPRQERRRARRSICTTRGWRASSRRAATCRATSCSSTSTRTASGRRSTPPT